MKKVSLLRDEQGNLSAARWFLALTLGNTLALGWVDVLAGPRLEVPQALYTLLAGAIGAFALWAGGPRMAQYLAPVVSSWVKAVAESREPSRADDMRDEADLPRGPAR